MRVVLDTNVIVSGLLNPHGTPGGILGLLLNGKITLCYDSRILYEYQRVLAYPKFKFTKSEVDALIEFIKYEGIPVTAEPCGVPLKDKSDRPFLEVGLSAGAEYLVTGNTKHFPGKIEGLKVVGPNRFVEDCF